MSVAADGTCTAELVDKHCGVTFRCELPLAAHPKKGIIPQHHATIDGPTALIAGRVRRYQASSITWWASPRAT